MNFQQYFKYLNDACFLIILQIKRFTWYNISNDIQLLFCKFLFVLYKIIVFKCEEHEDVDTAKYHKLI